MLLKPDTSLAGALYPSPNVEERRCGDRLHLVVLHYTGMGSAQKAIEWLANPASKVSCHYVVDEEGFITQMVPERLRAWHAGVSHWAGENDVNSVSIGIEIQNPGHDKGYPDFPPAQMQAVVALCRDIALRRGIRPEGILAHSDVAPGRKVDPGEKFDWGLLARNGVGHWVEPAALDAASGEGIAERDTGAIAQMQSLLRCYGYGIETTGCLDERTRIVIRAFQSHFRPARADGRLDCGTFETLTRLLAALPVAVAAET